MVRLALAVLASVLTAATAGAAAPETAAPANAASMLERIMADPDWIGPPVEDPYWSVDGRSLYFKLKRKGSPLRDLYRVDVAGGAPVKLADAQLACADGPPVFDRARHRAAFLRHGDVFVRDIEAGTTRQLTRTDNLKQGLRFSADGRTLSWRDGGTWMVCDPDSGVVAPAATLKTENDPAAPKRNALQRLQLDLFATLRDTESDRKAERERRRELDRSDPTRASEPFYFGDTVRIVGSSLSPDARWMLVVTAPKAYDAGRKPTVTHYVDESGYPETEPVRTYVGRNAPAPQSLVLLDLRGHRQYPLPTDALPGIDDDPLASLRAARIAALEKAGHDDEAKALAAPKTRPVVIGGFDDSGNGDVAVAWAADGSNAAIELVAADHKDRWIAMVDFDRHALVTQDRLTDPAWINWSFNEFGWLPDDRTLWFDSEASGWAQLFVKSPGGKARALTGTGYEVSSPQVSPDGKWIYVLANKEAPYAYDVYRVPAGGGELQRVTRYQGVSCFECDGLFTLSPDGTRLAVLHSSAYVPPQLAVVNADGTGARDLTDTRTPEYKAMHWIEPRFVKVPSTHGPFGIWAKYYQAADYDTSQPHPAAFFVHGAGYLQDVTKGWSTYFLEQMFNNLLAQEGYAVLDMDYRASAGYGRDWRTAIYRNMGHPELEDLLDGKAWLVQDHAVDPRRVGIYGGSYGGFLTEMALLRAPGEFAAGAALRAPSDWTSYNDLYTSDILNDPQLDPEAYKTSSPIEYAEKLQDPLLIMHGLIDDNVMPGDSIRLYQRFIELHKQDFWISLYPTERHSFTHADDWYDEYRRIHELFARYVKDKH